MSENKINDQLKELLDQGGKWARLATNVEGLNVVRLPELKNRPARLALEINPIMPSVGRPQKKSLFLTSMEQLEEYIKIFKTEIVNTLMDNIEDVNGDAKSMRNKEKFIGKLDTDSE